MTMENALVPRLPNLPIQLYSIVGGGLIEKELMLRYYNATTPQEAMAIWRSNHSAERCPHRSLFYMEPQGDKALVHFLLNFEGKKRTIGRTDNDPLAAQILIGNWRAGRAMTSINWELYEDPNCENLIEMGRFDQWDLLKNIDEEKLKQLMERGVAPRGDWDFDQMLWPIQCSVCGTSVSVNGHFYNIDSAVCAKCGNRPWLAPSLHHLLDVSERMDHEQRERLSLHAFRWMGGVGAKYSEVRRNIEDRGERLKLAWGETLMGKSLEHSTSAQVRNLLESNTGTNFEVYQACCEKVQKALDGDEPFGEEHKIALDLAVRTTELIRVRLLTTQEH